MTNRPNIARTAITLGVIGSLAGNVTWAWPRSPVLVGVGVFMSLVLPVAVRLFKASSGATGWARIERGLVFGFICGGAALYSLLHISMLLHDLGLPVVIAWVPAAVMEALVVQAARAGMPNISTRARAVTSPAKAPARAPAQPRRDTAPPPKTKPAAPEKAPRVDEEQVTVDGVTFWAVRIPDDASDAERDRIGATNRTRKARAKKAQMNGVAA